jgi:NADP-dependent 3-hydroxy acid dehydrogenase YdfG
LKLTKVLEQHLNMPTAVITGANSGIGHALAQILVKEVPYLILADPGIIKVTYDFAGL